MAENKKELFDEIATTLGLTYQDVVRSFTILNGHYDKTEILEALAVLLAAEKLGYTEGDLDELVWKEM